jgi:hypothetical protein
MAKPTQGIAQLDQSEQQFAAARTLLAQLIQLPELKGVFDPEMRTNSRMVYTHAVTLWLLILQRLGNGLSLSEAVSQILHHHRDLLPENKRVRENTLSQNSSAYSKARQRLPRQQIEEFCHQICDYLGRVSEPLFDGRRVFVLDGTTITLPPTASLKKAFPPATNQHGTSVWPIAMLMVAHELQSGCALLPQVDPMFGENNSSEAAQARAILCRLPPHSIVMADSGFGIFSVAYASVSNGHDFLFRLSTSRYKSLRRAAELIEQGPNHKSYSLHWTPSAKERANNAQLPPDASLEIVIHEAELPSGVMLYTASSLEIDAGSATELYGRRYDVEFDIRDIKVTMDTENIRAKSVDMVMKELMTSVVAYNLVAQFRRQSAKLAKVKPRQLSFKGVWTTFCDQLLLQHPLTYGEWLDRYAAALVSAGDRKHPQRKSPREYPRQAHVRRQKSTKFQRLQRDKPKLEGKPPPPMESN